MADTDRNKQDDLTPTKPLTLSDARTGIRVMVLQDEAFPVLKVLLPGQPDSSQGIEVEFPEHVTGRHRASQVSERLYLLLRGVRPETREAGAAYHWEKDKNALTYRMDLRGKVAMTARAELEPDGIRFRYTFTNHSDAAYEFFQPVTCVRLYDTFTDSFLKRMYVHHKEGFDLLASETPERMRMSQQEWLPCRYLVSYTWPVPPRERHVEKVEGIRRYNKSRRVDQPFLASLSTDQKWIAATYTRETGNLWTNPERTCHHADPATELNPGETRSVELKVFLFQGDLKQLLEKVRKERGKMAK
jgi:hypothetical protein